MNVGYVHDSQSNVWVRTDGASLGYSDGEQFESGLLDIIERASDVSSTSKELRSAIIDWPTDYHLSNCRHNLLRPFGIGAGHRVLELGCGCGALTRYLGESGADVVSVEGSVRRARIAAARCRDLPNVMVYCDNLVDFTSTKKFDFVLLVGVLEYAPKFIEGDDPIGFCVSHAHGFLGESGVLFLAIENQLGLKYFNGCVEDHIGIPYYGLQGLYRGDEPTTFGRTSLQNKLVAAGLPYHLFFYPFPDYKLPQVIFSDAAFSTPGFDAAALLMGMASGDAEGEFHPNFYENLSWRPIIDNGLLPHLANSFLILAGASEDALGAFARDWLACAYTMSRIPAYATETRFACSNNSPILVEKRCLYPDIPVPKIDLPAGRLLHRVDTVSDYVVGRPYLLELQQRLGRGEGVAGIVEWAVPWLDLLLAHSKESENGMILPGDWIDAIPQNFIREADGNLQRIDDEWTIEGFVSLAWVLVRGLVNALVVSPSSERLSRVNLQEIIQNVAADRGIVLTRISFISSVDSEVSLQTAVRAEKAFEVQQGFEKMLRQPPCCRLTHPLMQFYLRERVTLFESEITRIKSTFSWKITKPLRFLANLPRIAQKYFKCGQGF